MSSYVTLRGVAFSYLTLTTILEMRIVLQTSFVPVKCHSREAVEQPSKGKTRAYALVFALYTLIGNNRSVKV